MTKRFKLTKNQTSIYLKKQRRIKIFSGKQHIERIVRTGTITVLIFKWKLMS